MLQFQSFNDSFDVFPVKHTNYINDVFLHSVENPVISRTNSVERWLESLEFFNVSFGSERIGRDFFDRSNNFSPSFFRNTIQIING